LAFFHHLTLVQITDASISYVGLSVASCPISRCVSNWWWWALQLQLAGVAEGVAVLVFVGVAAGSEVGVAGGVADAVASRVGVEVGVTVGFQSS
jgi:hypothetical protein